MTTRPDLLNALTDHQAAALKALGSPLRLAPSQQLFTLGGTAQSVFVIERGRVALTLPMEVRDRHQDVLLEERGPGQTVGWSALTPPHLFTLTATAMVETDVLAMTREALLAHFRANPDVGYLVMQNVASIVGQRLQVFRAMWLREMQRVVKLSYA
jgi:CRP-like cAMP-binding protein